MNSYNGSNFASSAAALVLSLLVSITLIASAGVPATANPVAVPAVTIVA